MEHYNPLTRFITGEKISNLCDVICTDTPSTSNSVDIGSPSFEYTSSILPNACNIFVRGTLLHLFRERVLPHIKHPVCLMTHNSDECITEQYIDILNNPNIEKWYSQNIKIVHNKLRLLPIGIANPIWPHGNEDVLVKVQNQTRNTEKRLLVYLNFYNRPKDIAYDILSNFGVCDLITIEMGLPYETYLHNMAQHKYNVCPEGNGIDTHRLWETLYMGSIPIVKGDPSKDPFYMYLARMDLPIMYVDAWKDITPTMLKEQYTHFSRQQLQVQQKTCPFDIQWYKNETQYNIMLVHLGEHECTYLQYCVQQIRVFNKVCNLHVIFDSQANLDKFTHDRTDLHIHCHILTFGEGFAKYAKHSKLDTSARNGFWIKCSQRFFALHEIASRYNLSNIVHMENDIMLYQDITNIINILYNEYSNIAATFDNDQRGIPGFIYFKDTSSIQMLCDSFMEHPYNNDMEMLRLLQRKCSSCIDNLPIVPKAHGEYSKNADKFNCIFDAAYIGQYVGGIDPRNGDSVPGYINPDCVVKMDDLTFEWRMQDNKKVPYLDGMLVNNLHIHSKKLETFLSI